MALHYTVWLYSFNSEQHQNILPILFRLALNTKSKNARLRVYNYIWSDKHECTCWVIFGWVASSTSVFDRTGFESPSSMALSPTSVICKNTHFTMNILQSKNMRNMSIWCPHCKTWLRVTTDSDNLLDEMHADIHQAAEKNNYTFIVKIFVAAVKIFVPAQPSSLYVGTSLITGFVGTFQTQC